MRIALVSQRYPPETPGGGIATQTLAKAHGLAARGHQVIVVSRSVDDTPHEVVDGAIRVVRIAGREPFLPQTPASEWIAHSMEVAVTLARLHAESPIDLVDVPEWGAEGYVHLLNRTSWSSVPTVVHLHGPLVMLAHRIGWPELDSEFFRVGTHMEGTCLRLADAICSSSRVSAGWCQTHYGIDARQVPVLHTGVDTRLFRPASRIIGDRPTILYASAVAANKGIELLLEAAIRLSSDFPDLRLRVLGSGEPAVMARLRARAQDAGREELLELAGFCPHDELPREMEQADVFAVPSEYEGGPGLVYLEAMASGLPVIACDGSGVVEIIRSEVNGLLIPPGEGDALYHALRRVLTDRELGARLSVAARNYATAEADAGRCLDRIEEFYRGVVQTHGASLF